MDCQLFHEDMEYILSRPFIDWDKLSGKTIFITGASGLIGSNLVRSLSYACEKKKLGLHIAAFVRNKNKALRLLRDMDGSGCIEFVEGDVLYPIRYGSPVDFVIHAASPTSSRLFMEKPVDVIRTAVLGTMNVLDFSKENGASGVVYLSSMEVYGTPHDDGKIGEDHPSDLDVMNPRSSYPESKRLCESLCASYCRQYGLKTDVIRLTQTFGPGVDYDDQRVFAQFARSAIEDKDIVLATAGRTRRSYLYTADAVSAVLSVMLSSPGGRAYNAANEESYCSIREMAELVLRVSGSGRRVIVQSSGDASFYAPELHMNLDISRLFALGWRPGYSLEDSFRRLIRYMMSCRQDSDGI